MKERVLNFIRVTKSLIDYIEDEQVFDKMADAGCGYIDSYRSEKFELLIKSVRDTAEDLANEVKVLD